jgi:hypothetical protein
VAREVARQRLKVARGPLVLALRVAPAARLIARAHLRVALAGLLALRGGPLVDRPRVGAATLLEHRGGLDEQRLAAIGAGELSAAEEGVDLLEQRVVAAAREQLAEASEGALAAHLLLRDERTLTADSRLQGRDRGARLLAVVAERDLQREPFKEREGAPQLGGIRARREQPRELDLGLVAPRRAAVVREEALIALARAGAIRGPLARVRDRQQDPRRERAFGWHLGQDLKRSSSLTRVEERLPLQQPQPALDRGQRGRPASGGEAPRGGAVLPCADLIEAAEEQRGAAIIFAEARLAEELVEQLSGAVEVLALAREDRVAPGPRGEPKLAVRLRDRWRRDRRRRPRRRACLARGGEERRWSSDLGAARARREREPDEQRGHDRYGPRDADDRRVRRRLQASPRPLIFAPARLAAHHALAFLEPGRALARESPECTRSPSELTPTTHA